MILHFTAREHEDTGELGWLDSRASSPYEPLDYAYGLAHDCLEHFALSTVADEIEAHGAMYWGRYEGNWSHPGYSYTLTLDALAQEWNNLYRGLEIEPCMPVPPNTRPLDKHIEDDISTIMENGNVMVRHEYDEFTDNDILEKITKVFRAYFRRGYRKAQKRYRGIPSYQIGQLYNKVAKAFELTRPEYEWQEIEVHINARKGEIKIREID